MSLVSGGAYDKNFQQQLLAHLRWEDALLKDAIRVLTVDDFELPVMRITYEALQNHYTKYKKLPMTQELDDGLLRLLGNVDGTARSGVNPEEYEALSSLRLYIMSMQDPCYRNFERFREELPSYISWVRTIRVLGSMSPAIYRGANPQTLMGQMIEIDKEVTTKLETHSTQSVFSSNTGIMMTPEDADFKVSTGVSNLNVKMDGGLGLGELGMVTACPGLGKTMTLINFGAGANFARQHALFISLELPDTLIKRRYAAIAACILGKTVKSILTTWSPEEQKRYQMLLDSSFQAHDLFTVSDKAGKIVTEDIIEAEIDVWREHIKERWGKEEGDSCTSVLIDWADLMHLRNEGKNEAEHLRIRNILRELKAIAVRKNIALWTATQGTKEADGKQVLHMRHVSYGYHKNDAIDIGIGLGLAQTDQQADAYQRQLEAEGAAQEIADNGRTLIFNFNKNRNALTGAVRVYQSPTLRLYNKVEDYRHHDKQLRAADTATAAFQAAPQDM